ncbi:hypothetical protein F5890DRAFT_1477196 [Lentinula detonsa]|uniref:Uncharacterized protein n=1 Tax=Lentinula detonsa TaxID=2804962 RepID=A0AA38PT23_9AGAR|nr:hypothetical protein F5890DRAFT_1477196 [Lentinula detonsa]
MTTIHSPAPTSRRTIRFAPLPDPRRSVLVTDDGTELPLLSPLIMDGQNFDFLASKLEMPFTDASELASIPAAMSLSALNSPVQTPSQTPQSWNVPLPDVASSLPTSTVPASTSSSESDGSNSSNNSSNSSSSPPTSEISSSASSMYSLTPTQSIDRYPASTGSSTPTQSARKSSSLRNKLSSKYNISTDQILTLGTINLFRRGSKGKDKDESDTDSISSAQGWGNALTRWTSAGSGGPRSGRDGVGVPIYRTQSTQSYKGENVRNAKRSSSPASTNSRNKPRSSSTSSKLNPAHQNGMISTLHTGQSKKGTRMLNGRVYGAKRGSISGSQANPFANAKDDPDPEFVEWGYGGMGSVKNVQDGVGGTVWGRVLSNGTSVLDSGCPEKRNSVGRAVQNGDSRDDDDDGSGMGWVRKRREIREKAQREAREQAEKERQEREAQEKAKTTETSDLDASDSRSFTSTTTTGTSGTATSTSPAGTSKNIPTPLPLPDLGGPDASQADSFGVGSPVGSPTPTFGSTMVTPTASAVSTPKPRAIEGVLSSSASPERNVVSPDLRAASMSRQASNTPTISNLGGASSPGKDEQHHVMTAINVPAPPPLSKHHSSHHSRGKSLQDAIPKFDLSQDKNESLSNKVKDLPPSESVVGARASEDTIVDIQQGVEEKESDRIRKSRHGSVSSVSSSASSTSSQSESESDSESEKNVNDSDDEDEEEEDESEEEKARKTSLGAGVEKVSRHK